MAARSWRSYFRRVGQEHRNKLARCTHKRQQHAAGSKPLRFESLEDRHLLSAVRLDAEQPVGDVSTSYEVSPDGEFAVYTADAEADSRFELYSVEFSTGEVRKLSHPSLQGRVRDIQISPDSDRVIYRTWENNESRGIFNELYSVPIVGGDAIKLNGPLVQGGGAFEFLISRDSSQVVYRADQDIDGVHELFSVSIDGGTPIKLNRPLTSGHEVQPDFQLSADSNRVVFSTGQDDTFSLFQASIDGSDLVEVADLQTATFPADNDELAKFSPDSTHLVFLSVTGLLSVELASGSVTTLATGVEPGFQISADSAHVVYVSGSDLFQIPLGGGDEVRLNDSRVEFDEVQPDVRITPDSNRVVYRADQDTDEVIELYTVAIAGGPSTKLNNNLVEGGDVDFDRDGLPQPVFQITPDSQRVVYIADGRSDDVLEVYSARLDGSGSTVVSDRPISLDGYLGNYTPNDDRFPRLSPDGDHVVYWVDGEIYRAPAGGGQSTKLNPPLVLGGRVSGYRFTPDSSRVMYRGMQEAYGTWELFSAPITGGNSIKHSGPLFAMDRALYSDDVYDDARLSPDGKYALYRFSNSTEEEDRVELFSVEVATGAVARLSDALVEGSVRNYELTPDSTHVVYVAQGVFTVPVGGGNSAKVAELPRRGSWIRELRITNDSQRVVFAYPSETGIYSAPIGTGLATRLDNLGDGDEETDWWLSPDSKWVVYSAGDGAAVYSVPVEGGPSSRLIDASLGGGRLRDLEIAPDSSHVVYWGDEEVENRFELFSVPISGGLAVKLSGELGESGDVSRGFTISSDSRYVIYRADPLTDERHELYSVFLAGGDATKLNGPLVADGGDVLEFQVSADGHTVVYRADQGTDQQHELFSVSVGGGEVTRLNRTLEAGHGVLSEYRLSPDSSSVVFATGRSSSFPAELIGIPIGGGESVSLGTVPFLHDNGGQPVLEFSPDSSRVLYRSLGTGGASELFSAGIQRGDLVKLNGPLVDGGSVTEYALSRDSSRVVYRADQEQDGVFELYAVPTTGGQPEKVNGPLVTGGDVHENKVMSQGTRFGFAITADSSHVVYLADEEADRQVGLYARALPLEPDLLVSSFVPDQSGFTIEFNRELDASRLNLYDAGPVKLGSADIVLEGSTSGAVSGSLVLDSSHRGLRFIASGGPLAADTYTVRLRSGPRGLQSTDQYLLNGDGEGSAGDDYSTSFTISASGRVVGVPDFVRSPGQAIDLSGHEIEGIPLTISEGSEVRSVSLRVEYDPALLTIAAAQVAPDMPASAAVDVDTTTPGVTVVNFTSGTDLPAGEQTFVYLQGTIPEGDGASTYGLTQVVYLRSVAVQDSIGLPVPAVADHALQVVSLFGDVTFNGRVDTVDASAVSRVAAAIESGFAANTLLDPRLVGDVTGNGTINAADALRMVVILAGLDPNDLPPSGPPNNDPPEPPDPPDPQPPSSTSRLDRSRAVVGDVTEYVFTADGRFAVYLADSTVEHQFELYSVELASGDIRKLSDVTEAGSVGIFRVSADSRRVVYMAKKAGGPDQLYSVSVDGDGSTRLNDTLPDGGSVANAWVDFLISPDSSRVVYVADQEIEGVVELFSVPIEGGTATRLNAPLANRGDVFNFKISSDSRFVVYRGDQDQDFVLELYSVPLAGGTPTQLSDEATNRVAAGVGNYQISPDGSYVVFGSNHLVTSVYALYGVSITGGTVVELSPSGVFARDIEFSPNGRHVVYQAGSRLYSVPTSGEEFVQLASTFGPVSRFQITADSRQVVFSQDRNGTSTLYSTPLERQELNQLTDSGDLREFLIGGDGSNVFYVAEDAATRDSQLYRVPIAGGESMQLSDSNHGIEEQIQLSPDGRHVVYLDGSSIYSVPAAGGLPNELNGVADGELRVDRSYEISGDSQWVAFAGRFRPERSAAWVAGVYSSPLAGGSPTLRSEPLDPAAERGDFAFAPGSNQLVYLAEQDQAGVTELFDSPRPGLIRKLSAAQMALGGTVTDTRLSPDGQFVVYRADHDVEGVFELYTVSTLSGGIVKLNGTLLDGDVEPDFQISADGSRVVYRASEDGQYAVDLYSVWLTGGGAVRLNRPVTFGEVLDFEISPDSSRVIYRAEETQDSLPRLYSVPLNGGPSTMINGPLTRSNRVRGFQIAPDSSWVIYQADHETRRLYELYRVPITGGEFTKVSDPIDETGRIDEFEISPDGERVVYRANEASGSRVDLFSVPAVGGDAVKLNGTLETYDGFQIASSGDWVVFPSGGHLYSVPTTGGPLVRLNDPDEGSVHAGPVISPDGAHVVYLTSLRGRSYFGEDLYRVPIAGGNSTRITDSVGLVGSGQQISPDGETVVFRAIRDSNLVEVFSVPILGGAIQKLNGPITPGGDVDDQILIGPDGLLVIYTADQDIDGQVGIYLVTLE